MAEYVFWNGTVPYSLDHACVVPSVGEYVAVGQGAGKCVQGTLIGDIAGSEEKGGGFVVKGGQLGFKLFVKQSVAGNVAGAAGTGAVFFKGITKKRNTYFKMLEFNLTILTDNLSILV